MPKYKGIDIHIQISEKKGWPQGLPGPLESLFRTKQCQQHCECHGSIFFLLVDIKNSRDSYEFRADIKVFKNDGPTIGIAN